MAQNQHNFDTTSTIIEKTSTKKEVVKPKFRKFADSLKSVLHMNTCKTKFRIQYIDRRELFTTKKELGLRLLELFNDSNTARIWLSGFRTKGSAYEHTVCGFDKCNIKELHNIDLMSFYVESK